MKPRRERRIGGWPGVKEIGHSPRVGDLRLREAFTARGPADRPRECLIKAFVASAREDRLRTLPAHLRGPANSPRECFAARRPDSRERAGAECLTPLPNGT